MQRFLFVSAPFGPFFRRLVSELEARNCRVWRSVSKGGELLETPKRCRLVFRNGAGDWKEFLRREIRARHITAVVTFNDTLPRNRDALAVARELGVDRLVLENGYLRPHWVTLDREGVNGFTLLPSSSRFYLDQRSPPVPVTTFAYRLRPHVVNAIKHFVADVALSPILPVDFRYYGDSIFTQARGYVREYVWRGTHDEVTPLDRIVDCAKVEGAAIFVALLQKPGDAQLVVHSDYGGNNPFLAEICRSFRLHAPANAHLVVKQHPLDYAIERTPEYFERLVVEHGLQGRAHYLRKTSIDPIMDVASGVVTINSTGGLQAVQRLIPTICCGRAFYDIDGLTHRGGLDTFWTSPEKPDPNGLEAFMNYLMTNTQVNGGFHSDEALALLVPTLADRMVDGVFAAHTQENPRIVREIEGNPSCFVSNVLGPRIA